MGFGMGDDYEFVEVLCTEVFVYDKYNITDIVSGIAEIEALDDDEIYVVVDDDVEGQFFKRHLVHACNSDL